MEKRNKLKGFLESYLNDFHIVQRSLMVKQGAIYCGVSEKTSNDYLNVLCCPDGHFKLIRIDNQKYIIKNKTCNLDRGYILKI